MTKIIKYFFLFFIIVCSYFIVRNFDPNFTSKNQSFSFYKLLGPGILFSIYILILFRRSLTISKLILYFFTLTGFYFLTLYLGMMSWGLTTPLFGGIGAYIIKKLFHLKIRLYLLAGLGFIASLVGLMFVYLTQNKWTMGTSFSMIIGLWQLIIGIKCIVETEQGLINESIDI